MWTIGMSWNCNRALLALQEKPMPEASHGFPFLNGEAAHIGKTFAEAQVTAFITSELRNSIRFLERIYCHDELRLHQMPLGERLRSSWKMLEDVGISRQLAVSCSKERERERVADHSC